ncbi:MAG: hypothetical protein AAED33_11615 [Paracoccaceae bacterium]|jgi:Flp pilus assembly pilin Flp
MVFKILKRFARDESGAITVDFVILTAAIVGLGLSVMIIVAPGIKTATLTIEPVIQSSEGLAGKLFGTNQ